MTLQDINNSKSVILTILISVCLWHTSFVFRPVTSNGKLMGKSKDVINYAVLISQPNHVKAVINTAEAITKDSKYKRDTLVVMACAKSVEAFVKGNDFADMIQKGKAAGIHFKVCGMSLQQFNIDPAALIEGIEIVPNGLTYMFDLQMKGYKTVEL
jgi:intracellular sulfur oxidation DsrE/DsrF family protein